MAEKVSKKQSSKIQTPHSKSNNRPNIIFIVMDGIRPKNLGCYGYEQNTSPNMDLLSKQGILFENFFSSHNYTHKSFASIVTGRHIPSNNLARYHYHNKIEIESFFNSGGVCLQQILKDNGYKPLALRELYGWEKIGFDHYYEFEYNAEKSTKWRIIYFLKKFPFLFKTILKIFNSCNLIPKQIGDKIRFHDRSKSRTNEAIELIKQNKKNKFFLWVDYEDTHFPYNVPSFLTDKFIPEEKGAKFFNGPTALGASEKRTKFLKTYFKSDITIGEIMAKYNRAIYYNDYLVGKIIDTLKKEDMLKNTIIFWFSDHGQNFGDHNLYLTAAGLYDPSVNIPLLIAGGKIPKNKRINGLSQLEDLVPTILDLAGINYPSSSFDGQNLLPLISEEKKEIKESIFLEENCA